jgi:hypothetical protein
MNKQGGSPQIASFRRSMVDPVHHLGPRLVTGFDQDARSRSEVEQSTMMQRTLVLATIIATLLSPSMASAANAAELTVIGAGTLPCGSWTEARAHQNGNVPNVRAVAQLSWVQVFITALDTVRAGGPSIAAEASAPTLMKALDGYCKDHPTDDIAMAAMKVATELLEQALGR